MCTRLLLLLLSLGAPACVGYPTYWVSSPGTNGECGLLVSQRKGNDGMGASGYAEVSAPGSAVPDGNGSWELPSPTRGWFYTTARGEFSGAGDPIASCPRRFRSSLSAASTPIMWTPPTDGKGNPIGGIYTIEGASAPANGQISYFILTITVEPPSPSPPLGTVPPSSPPRRPPPTTPPSPPLQCSASTDFVVVGAGAGGSAAAAYLASSGVSAIVLSDGPDNTGALRAYPAWQTLYNWFGRFSSRDVINSATGTSWQQIVGAGGNNLHNGGVNQMPPLDQLDAILGGDGVPTEAALWLARQPVSHMVEADTPECDDIPAERVLNRTYKYLRGPVGCAPHQLYMYCDTDPSCTYACTRPGCSIASVHGAVGGALAFRGATENMRKTTMYTDLLEPLLGPGSIGGGSGELPSSDHPVAVWHDTRAERIAFDESGRAMAVVTTNGEAICARCGVISAGGVFGTSELLMRSLGLTQLGGLWEQTVVPINPVSFYSPVGETQRCADDLLSGNLHLATRTRAQAEYTICKPKLTELRFRPKLLAAWVIAMNATRRGTITLEDGGTGGRRVSASLEKGTEDESLAAVNEIYSELRSRYGSNLVLPGAAVRVALRLGTHHLGGGVQGAASAGRVTGVPNLYVGDMAAYDEPVFGYTTGAAAVAGIAAAMRAISEGSCVAPPFPPAPPRMPPSQPSPPSPPPLPPAPRLPGEMTLKSTCF